MMEKVLLTVSDPWSFLDENGSLEMTGLAEQIEVSELVVALDRQYSSKGRMFDRVTVRPRQEESTLNKLELGKSIPANISFNNSGFLIGSVTLAGHTS